MTFRASSYPPPFPAEQPTLAGAATGRDFESQLGPDFGDESYAHGSGDEGQGAEAVHFILLAEFDIDAGATLAHQYPYPTGTDEHRLAELMLPDGAHLRPEDWTVFYLGQTASSAVAPMLSHESSMNLPEDMNRRASMLPLSERPKQGVAGGGLLYVLNCVRMKEDKKMRRGAMVKAMAICTPHPYIGIYKPLLLLALEEYFATPTHDVLARLYDTVNSIPMGTLPTLSKHERILLRQSDRKDLFEEKFRLDHDNGLREIFDETISDAGASLEEGSVSGQQRGLTSSASSVIQPVSSSTRNQPAMIRKSSASSSQLYLNTPPSREGRLTPDMNSSAGTSGEKRKGAPKDTHFFETEAMYKKIRVPIRVPLTVFDEDVGDYSIIELVNIFPAAYAFPPPFYPHLHTNGPNTHPIILILNAMLAHKRVMFLGHGRPANQIARVVLATCAMATGSGQVLRGFTESAFPYANLASLDILEEFSGFVAGVTNPRFEELPATWDVLCNVETGKVTVSKMLQSGSSVGNMRSGQISDTSLTGSIVKVEEDGTTSTPQAKMSSVSKADCVDNQFMEEITAAIATHFGEAHIRLRFTDYINRFVRLAAFQEFSHMGRTKIGFPSMAFRDGWLGSGTVFSDDAMRQRELSVNGHRIDAWRKTKSYKLFAKDWQKDFALRPVADFDLAHQIARLRNGKTMRDQEADAVFDALAGGVRTYDQVIELLTLLPAHFGGLVPIANGLFHRLPSVRQNTLEILATIQQHPAGRQAVASMNYFHRKTYLQLIERRDDLVAQQRLYERQSQLHSGLSDSREYDHSSGLPPTAYAPSEIASPGTVHGSLHNTPQGVSRA